MATVHSAAVARLEIEAALSTTRTELRRALDAQRADQTAWETDRQELEARLSAQRNAAVEREHEGTLGTAREDLQRALDAHCAEQVIWANTRLELETRVNDLQAALDAKNHVEFVVDAARAELMDASKPYVAKRATWGGKHRQLEKALDVEAVTTAAIESESVAAELVAKLDRAGLARSGSSTRGDIETALTSIRTALERLMDAHASETSAWKMASEHTESELKDAVLEAERHRARLAAVSSVLEPKAGADQAARGVA